MQMADVCGWGVYVSDFVSKLRRKSARVGTTADELQSRMKFVTKKLRYVTFECLFFQLEIV